MVSWGHERECSWGSQCLYLKQVSSAARTLSPRLGAKSSLGKAGGRWPSPQERKLSTSDALKKKKKVEKTLVRCQCSQPHPWQRKEPCVRPLVGSVFTLNFPRTQEERNTSFLDIKTKGWAGGWGPGRGGSESRVILGEQSWLWNQCIFRRF